VIGGTEGGNSKWKVHTPFVGTVITGIAIGILEEKGPEEGRSTEGVTPGTPEPPVSTHIFTLQSQMKWSQLTPPPHEQALDLSEESRRAYKSYEDRTPLYRATEA
jgi:hypothetical protein